MSPPSSPPHVKITFDPPGESSEITPLLVDSSVTIVGDVADSAGDSGWADNQGGQSSINMKSKQRDETIGKSRSLERLRKIPWYKRPHPFWFFPSSLILSLAMGMTIGSKIEVYTRLVCSQVSAESSSTPFPQDSTSIYTFNDNYPVSSSYESGSLYYISTVNKGAEPIGNGTDWIFIPSQDEEEQNGSPKPPAKAPDHLPDDASACRKNPLVQKATTALNVTMTLIMGLLSSLTTGFWGSVSDRYGRKKIGTIAILGVILNDCVFLFTVNYSNLVGYRFLIIGPLLDGLLGGQTTASAAMTAYISDCTESGSRAKTLSYFHGLFFAGMALGPSLGSLVLYVSNSLLAPFWGALLLHTLQLTYLVVFLPESLSKERQELARKKHDERPEGSTWAKPFSFLTPLSLLLPRIRDLDDKGKGKAVHGSPSKKGKLDWSLTFVALCYALFVMSMGIYAIKAQYSQLRFDWGAEQIGVYLSFIGVCRVIAMMVILPLVIRVFKKKPPLPDMPSGSQAEVEEGGESQVTLTGDQLKEWEREAKKMRIAHDARFDLKLARFSVIADIASYVGIVLATDSIHFVLATAVQSLAGGAIPALQSLALSLSDPSEAGQLLAGLGVLQAVFSQVLGPLIYGSIYSATVGYRPESVFMFALAIYVTVFLCTFLPHLPKYRPSKTKSDLNPQPAERRGRSRTRKQVSVNNRSVIRSVSVATVDPFD